MDGNEFRRVALVASFREKKLNDLFGFVIVAFAEMMIAPASLRIDEVVGRPISIVEGAPDGVVAVDRDRIPIFKSATAACTLLTLRSNANSGVCTPITTSP